MLPYVSESLWRKCQLRMNVLPECKRVIGDLSPTKGLSVRLDMKMMSLVEASAPGNVHAHQ